MSDPKFGEFIRNNPHQIRDAIHIATVSMLAGENLLPGERVGIKGGNSTTAFSNSFNPIGIVDPFLPEDSEVKTGDRFWLFLLPGSITGLQHRWSHPAFRDAETESETKWSIQRIKEAEEYLINLANDSGVSFDHLIRMIKTDGGVVRDGCHLNNEGLSDADKKEFEIFTGIKVTGDPYFRCAC